MYWLTEKKVVMGKGWKPPPLSSSSWDVIKIHEQPTLGLSILMSFLTLNDEERSEFWKVKVYSGNRFI